MADVVAALVHAIGSSQTFFGAGAWVGQRVIVFIGDRSGGVTASCNFAGSPIPAVVSETSHASDTSNRRSAFFLAGVVPPDAGNAIITSTVLDAGDNPVDHVRIAVVLAAGLDYPLAAVAVAESETSEVTLLGIGPTEEVPAGDVIVAGGETTRGVTTVSWNNVTHQPPHPEGGTWDLSGAAGSGANARRGSMGIAHLTGEDARTYQDLITYGTARQSSAVYLVFSSGVDAGIVTLGSRAIDVVPQPVTASEPGTVLLGSRTIEIVPQPVTALGENGLSEDFTGTTLPLGWTVDSPLGGETVTVSDSRVHMTLPGGVAYDSIFNTSSDDNTAGIVHEITTADVDVAVQCDTDVSNTHGFQWNILVKGDTEADAFRGAIYTPGTGDAPIPRIFSFARADGAGASLGDGNIAGMNTGHYAWLRVRYLSATGEWTLFGSVDGVTWVQERQGTRQFTPTRLKISVGQSTASPGGTLRIQRVVDILAHGSTDVRDPVPPRTQVPVLTVLGTDGQLPPEMIDDSAVDGEITWTGTAMRMTQDLDVDQSRARIEWAGPTFAEGGVLALVEHVAQGTQAFLAVGIGRDTGNPSDQYSRGPGYVHESVGGTGRVAIRVDPNISTTGFEAPYTFLRSATDSSTAGVPTWIRVERRGRRIRMRDWPDGDPEPSTWRIDAQDQVQDGPYGAALAYSHNDGATQSGLRNLDVLELHVYELVEDAGTVEIGSRAIEITPRPLMVAGDALLGAVTLEVEPQPVTVEASGDPVTVTLGTGNIEIVPRPLTAVDPGIQLRDLQLVALSPVLGHGSPASPEFAPRTALSPELGHGAAEAPELGHGQPGPPTT